MVKRSISIYNLNILWFTNFDYEYRKDDKHAIVEVQLEGVTIKTHTNIDTTIQFVEILNSYNNSYNQIKILQSYWGNDHCIEKIFKNVNSDILLKVLL